jgi:hypothetical protein
LQQELVDVFGGRMGVIFQKQPQHETVRRQIDTALQEEAPETVLARAERVEQLTSAATAGGPVVINWKAFLVALAIFVGLLLLAIVVDWANIVDDPKVYSGLAGTALGAVLGFLTGDAAATASG